MSDTHSLAKSARLPGGALVSSSKGVTKRDRLAAMTLFFSTVCTFAWGAPLLGFYYDDSGFLCTLPFISNRIELWAQIRNYVPGRNLHILWQYLIFVLVRNPSTHLPALHYVQSILDGVAVVVFYVLLRRLALSAAACMTATALFAFWPSHGETHYWISSLPMNVVSTLFLLGFALTSIPLAEGKASGWVLALDLICFWCAILTYDQTYCALLLILIVRVLWSLCHRNPGWRTFLSAHVLHLSGAAAFLLLRFSAPLSGLTPFQKDSWPRIRGNIAVSLYFNGGRGGIDHMRTLSQKASGGDRWWAWVVAGLIAIVAIWLLKESKDSPKPGRLRRIGLIALASLFWIAAYFPVWLWHPAPRHHYLPTLGIFCTVAVLLDWIQDVLPHRVLSAAVHLGMTAIVFVCVVADRGESRYWEEAFQSKKWMLLGLRPQLQGKLGLVLDGFPMWDGPGIFITPHDAVFGLRVLMPDLSLPASFRGAVKAARSPEGIAMDPSVTLPQLAPVTLAAEKVLWLRYESWQNGVLQYSRINDR
jgi:hypothetical protein